MNIKADNITVDIKILPKDDKVIDQSDKLSSINSQKQELEKFKESLVGEEDKSAKENLGYQKTIKKDKKNLNK